MSKKASGGTGKNGAVNRPVPSGTKIRKRTQTGSDEPEIKIHHKNSAGGNKDPGSDTKKKKKLPAARPKKKNEDTEKKHTAENKKPKEPEQLMIGRYDYGDSFSNPDVMDRSAEEILKRPHQRESALHFMKPLPAAKAPISPYKRKLKRLLFYSFTVLFLVSVCIVLSLTVFFKIDEITVDGETRYNTEDIIESCMIEKGDNLILCRTSPGETNIWKKFPYIESVSIRKKLFNSIVITVEEAVPTTVIESNGKYVLLSESGKIIEISDKKTDGIPMILGAKLETPKLSSSVEYKDENMEEYIDEILCCASKYELGTLKIVDISNPSDIILEHEKGLRILLGAPDNIEHKIKTARKVIEKGVAVDDKGTLDVSLSAEDGGKSYFDSKKPAAEQPSKPEVSKPAKPSEQSSAGQQSGEEASVTEEKSGETGEDSENKTDENSGDDADESSEDDTDEDSEDDTDEDSEDDTDEDSEDDTDESYEDDSYEEQPYEPDTGYDDNNYGGDTDGGELE